MIVACVAALTPIEVLGEMVNIGTLFTNVLVFGAVIYLCRSDADVLRPFRVAESPWVSILGILFCLSLMLGLPPITWLRLVVWLVIGLVIYFAYGRRHSRLRHA